MLTGQVALVTGASRGIGAAIARSLREAGATVCLAATNHQTLVATRERLVGGSPGPRVHIRVLDVTDPAACRETVEDLIGELGSVDILVNSAGRYLSRRFEDHQPGDLEALWRVNVQGTWDMCQAVVGPMRAQGSGRIINIGSTAGKWASRNQAAYNVTKHAVVGLTRCLALELAADRITVNAICPGLVETDMVEQLSREQAAAGRVTPDEVLAAQRARIALGRFLQPEEIGPLAVYLASPGAAAMTGQSILLDGGMVFV